MARDLIGFVLGFFFGCCGLLVAGFLVPDYFRGAVVGLLTRMGLGVVLSVAADASGHLQSFDPNTVPYELLLAFGIAMTFVLGTIAGAIWAFGGRDEDEDEPPPPPPADQEYVTFTRR